MFISIQSNPTTFLNSSLPLKDSAGPPLRKRDYGLIETHDVSKSIFLFILDSGDGKYLDGHQGIICVLDVGVLCLLETLEVELIEVDPRGSPDYPHSLLALVYAEAVLQAHPVVLPMDLGNDGLQLVLGQFIDADQLVEQLKQLLELQVLAQYQLAKHAACLGVELRKMGGVIIDV